MHLNKILIIFILVTLSITSLLPLVGANSVQIGNNIYISNRQNLTLVLNDISNTSALSNDGAGNCLLNTNLINNNTANIFYMNNTDQLCYASLLINSTNTSGVPTYWYYLTQGQTEINDYKITSWNITSNDVELEYNSGASARSAVYASGASSKMNISNSNMSYLGYNAANMYGIYYTSSSNNIISNSSFLNNYRGFELYQSTNNTLINNTISAISGYGLYVAISSNNNTLTNNTVTSNSYHGIYVQQSIDNILTNNVGTSDTNDGIFLYSAANNNTLINNTGNSNSKYGMQLSTSSLYNIITGGSYTSASSYAYYITSSYQNTFNNTNFTVSRKIMLYDNTSDFTYDNGTGVWLRTQTIISPTSTSSTTRTLHSWTQSNITWSEIWTASREIQYNVSGLSPSSTYSIYNDTAIDYNYTTDASGILTPFTVNFTTTAKTIKILYVSSAIDTTSPTYSLVSNNNTKQGFSTLFSILYNDETALHPNGQWIFSTNNSGAWVNDSAVNFSATPEWANVTKTLNSTIGVVVGYRWYAFDNSTNSNDTPIYTLTVTTSSPPTFIPPDPINIANTTGYYFVNHTWQAGTGNVTDSYNATHNGTWYNGTTNLFFNASVLGKEWSNITVYAYNSSGTGLLSLGSITQNTQNNMYSRDLYGNVYNGSQTLTQLNATLNTGCNISSLIYRDPITEMFYIYYCGSSNNGSVSVPQGGGYWGNIGINTIPADPYIVWGRVTNNSIPVSSITVTITELNLTGSDTRTTDSDGYYIYDDLAQLPNSYASGDTIQVSTAWTSSSFTAASSPEEKEVNLPYSNDTSPPASITSLTNTTGKFFHNWTWVNPSDTDFNYTMIYINGTFITNTSSAYYNFSASAHNTSTLSTHTVDINGNINSTWVNQTSVIPNSAPSLLSLGQHLTNITANNDSYVNYYGANENYGSDDFIHIDSIEGEGLVDFNISFIPNGAIISSSELYLYNSYSGAGQTVGIYQINQSWNESKVTWNNQPTYINTSLDAKSVINVGWYNWNLTSITKSWSNSSIENDGVYLLTDSITYYSVLFGSKENNTNNPYLSVNYTYPNTVNEGEWLNFSLSASDDDSDALTYSTNATKGILTGSSYSWKPAYSDAGIYTWYFNATDTYGAVSTQVITITVNNVLQYPPTPLLDNVETGNFYVNTTWTAGDGNITDGYNSTNGTVWINNTLTYRNTTLSPHAWQNLTIYAYNSTDNVLSPTPLINNTQIPNNPIIISGITSSSNLLYGITPSVVYDPIVDIPPSNPEFITDGDFDISTQGTSAGGQADDLFYVQTDLGKVYNLSSLVIKISYTSDANSGLKVSSDNIMWNTIHTYNVPGGGTVNDTYYNIDNVRYIRSTLYTTSSGIITINWYEIQAYNYSYEINETETLSVDANYSDADNDTGTFSDNSSQWNVNTSTGIVSWTTGYSNSGTYNWNINVTDGYGLISYANFTVIVNDVAEIISNNVTETTSSGGGGGGGSFIPYIPLTPTATPIPVSILPTEIYEEFIPYESPYQVQKSLDLEIYSVEFSPSCNSPVYLTKAGDNISVASNCVFDTTRINFITPKNKEVLQSINGEWVKSEQQIVAETTDRNYYITQVTPESFGTFKFGEKSIVPIIEVQSLKDFILYIDSTLYNILTLFVKEIGNVIKI